MSFRRDSAITFATRILAFLIQASTGLILARLLGPAGRGQYALLILSPMLVTMLLSFGIGTSNAYFISQRRLHAADLYSNSLWLGLFFGIPATLAVFMFAETIADRFMPGANASDLRHITLCVPFILWFNYFLGIALGLQRFVLYNAANLLRPLVFLMLFVFLFYGMALSGVQAGLWAYTLGYVITSLILVFVLWPRVAAGTKLGIVRLGEIFRYGFPTYVAELSTYLFYRITLLFVGYYLNDEMAGYYAIVILITETLWFLSNSLSAVLLPFAAEQSPERLQKLVPLLVRHVVFLTFCFILVLLLIDRPLIRFAFGASFEPAVAPLRLVYPGILAMSGMKILSSYVLSQGKPRLNAITACIGLVCNVLLGLWLVPVWDIRGAAVASSVSYLLMAVLQAGWFLLTTRRSAADLLLMRSADWRLYIDTYRQIRTKIAAWR